MQREAAAQYLLLAALLHAPWPLQRSPLQSLVDSLAGKSAVWIGSHS